MKSVMQRVSMGLWLLVLVGCLSGGAAYANPANCDDDMTEDQRWTADLCSAHAGCRLVFGIMDSCIKAKSFLSRFGAAGSRRASRLTDDEVGDALVASGVPRSGLSSCLFSFDRAKCLEFLSGGPKPPSAKEKADALVEQLNSGVYNTTRENSPLALNRQALRMCEDATSEKGIRDAVRAKERCGLAEKGVQNCMSRKQSHDELRIQLQALIGDGSLGADAARYRALAATAYPECPTTLPASGKTPQAALAEYLKFWDTPVADGEPKGEVALPRRGGNSGGDRFRQAITQADQEERERPMREARERAERERVVREQAEMDVRERTERERIAAAEASLTPQQRLARSFDERISAARQQCTTRESGCNTGCLGIGAVGLISLFARNSAGTNAATEQMQQCTNRCDQEKSSCDQQVAALEQEKSQALAGGSGRGAMPVSLTAGAVSHGTGGGGAVCAPDEVLLQQFVDAQVSLSRNSSFLKPTTPDAARQHFRKIYDQNYRSSSLDRLQGMLADKRRDMETFKSNSPQAPMIRAETRVVMAMMECDINNRRNPGVMAGRDAGSGSGGGCAGSPQESFKKFDAEMAEFGRRFPNRADRGGSRDQYQYALFYGTSGIRILERYRNCMSAADYQANRNALEGMRSKGQRGCEQLSSSQGTCVPAYPANWAG